MVVVSIVSAVVALAYALVCAVAAGTLAERRGRTYRGFFALAFFLGVIGVVIAALVPPTAAAVRPGRRRQSLLDLERPVVTRRCVNPDCSAHDEPTTRELCVRCVQPTAAERAAPTPSPPPPPGVIRRFAVPNRTDRDRPAP